jgi:hypothetical protein
MELEIMFKDIMALAERKKMPLTSPQVVVDSLVGSFFEALSANILKKESKSYIEKIELLTAKVSDFNDKKRELEGRREQKEADRILQEFNEIFEAHVSSFWLYVEKVGDASWLSHKEAVRHAGTRWETKSERTITLIQTKANICIKNLQTYKVKYDKISQLKKLSKITSDQLFKAWLNRKNPITGYSLEID